MKLKKYFVTTLVIISVVLAVGFMAWMRLDRPQTTGMIEPAPAPPRLAMPPYEPYVVDGLVPHGDSCLGWTQKHLLLVSAEGEPRLILEARPGERIQQAWYQEGKLHYIITTDNPKTIRLISEDARVELDLDGAAVVDFQLFRVSYSPQCDTGIVQDGAMRRVSMFSFFSGREPLVLREKTYPSFSLKIAPNCSTAIWSTYGPDKSPAILTIVLLEDEPKMHDFQGSLERHYATYSTKGNYLITWGFSASQEFPKIERHTVNICDLQANPLRTIEFDEAVGQVQYVDDLNILVTARPSVIELVTVDDHRLKFSIPALFQAVALSPDGKKVWYATREYGIQSVSVEEGFIE